MNVPVNSAQTWRAAFTGCYDDEEIDLLLPYIRPQSLVLDVGASLGFYTLPLALAARRLGGHVMAIEPVRANCEVVARNVEMNGLGAYVSVLPFALGDRRGEVLLHIETGGAGNASIVSNLASADVAYHDRAGGTGDAQTAEVVPLDELELTSPAQSCTRCTLVKIDAEGFEMAILGGASSFITKHRPAIFGEFHPAWLTSRGVPPSAPLTWARENEYSCSELTYGRPHVLLERKKLSLLPLGADATRSGSNLLLLPHEGMEGPPPR